MQIPAIPLEYAKAAAAAALAAAMFAAGWVVNGWRLGGEIERIGKQQAQAEAKASGAALDDLAEASKKIRAAAGQFVDLRTTLGAKLDAIGKEMKDAKPLPVDCRPDAFRLRNLEAAVAAANAAAAGQ